MSPKYVVSLENGVTKEITAAYREWIKADKALLSLLIATLGDETIDMLLAAKLHMRHGLNLLIIMQ